MDPFDFLREEHSSVLRELYALDHQLGWLESSAPPVSRRALVQLLSTSQKLASDLSFHFQKEEKALYPLLERRMADNAEPVLLMREEHKRLSAHLDSFTSEVMRMLREHDTRKTWELSSKLQDLRSELSDHVSLEEKVLFWLAEIHLSRRERNKVFSGFFAFERPERESTPSRPLRAELSASSPKLYTPRPP